MATIQMVSRLNEKQGLLLAMGLANDPTASAVFWWAHAEESLPILVVAFSSYHEGPLNCIRRVRAAAGDWALPDSPDFLQTSVVGDDDPRVQLMETHAWHMANLDSPDLMYRLLNAYSPASGPAQALVYFLKAGGEVRVPLPPGLPQAA